MLNASAKELATRMWMGELSSVEVTQFYIDRIEKHNPAINAVIAERFEVALDEARQADEKVRRGEPLGALHGLPMTCLLYTSPSPRDLSTSRMPSSA